MLGRGARTWLVSGALAAVGACSVYDESLLEPDDGAGGDGAGASGPGPGGGACASPSDCPGEDSACRTRTCEAGKCGVLDLPAGTKVAMQSPGDCQEHQCDGEGTEVIIDAPDDVEDDGLQCTADACEAGAPTHTPEPVGAPCNQGGGSLCTGRGSCVECLDDGDCAGGVCDEDNACAPAICGDGVENGSETDIDCGGPTCPACEAGMDCELPSDCLSGVCTGGVCVASCSDSVQNGGETDIDCGGPCAPCEIGLGCSGPADCTTGNCSGGVCACGGTHLVLSEIRSRGAAGAADEFIEIYNPTSAPVTLDATWKVQSRSTSGSTYTDKWTGTGSAIPAHGHYLIAGAAYAPAPAADASLSSGVTDASSVRLTQSGATVDVVCYYFSAATLAKFQSDPVPYECDGEPVSNLPHNDSTAGQSNSDASIERAPGGPLGNCVDTGVSSADWFSLAPASPQATTSATTP